jgi:TonB family protein
VEAAEVDQVLAERERLARSGLAPASLVAAGLLHLAVVALAVLLPRLSPPPPPLEYVAVQVVPAQRLGVERPAPPPPATRPPAPAKPEEEPPAPPRSAEAPVLPRPAAPPPKPVKPEKPKPPKPDDRFDPTTRPKLLPPPRELLQQKAAAQQPPQAKPGPQGAPTGTATGKVAVGSSIAGLDNPDFTYDYYIAQMVSRIDQSWTRPPVGDAVRAVISFRIKSDGSISDLTVRESSGFDTFDLAALRAVQNAAPFPPLPRAYTSVHSSLGVDLIVR